MERPPQAGEGKRSPAAGLDIVERADACEPPGEIGSGCGGARGCTLRLVQGQGRGGTGRPAFRRRRALEPDS